MKKHKRRMVEDDLAVLFCKKHPTAVQTSQSCWGCDDPVGDSGESGEVRE